MRAGAQDNNQVVSSLLRSALPWTNPLVFPPGEAKLDPWNIRTPRTVGFDIPELPIQTSASAATGPGTLWEVLRSQLDGLFSIEYLTHFDTLPHQNPTLELFWCEATKHRESFMLCIHQRVTTCHNYEIAWRFFFQVHNINMLRDANN